MTREEAIKIARKNIHPSYDKGNIFEALKILVPELTESEDERIRKGLIYHLKELREWEVDTPAPIKVKEHYDAWIAYLEKQRNEAKRQYDLGVQAGKEEVLYDLEKQEEQKPAEWSEEDDMLMDELESYILYDKEFNDEQKSWRIKRLKSLRPQPKEDSEAIAKKEYERGKQDGYWEGVKAERDSCKTFHHESPNWPPTMPDLPTKTTTNECVSIINPHWKPSEEQMRALLNAEGLLRKYKHIAIASKLASLYEDLKKLLEE